LKNVRGLVLAVALMGCATAPSQPPKLVEGRAIEALSPVQVEQAFEGRALCVVYPEDGQCEGIVFLQSRTGDTLVLRALHATDINGLATDELAAMARQLRIYARYDSLFRRLAAERRGFRYLKTVTITQGEFNRRNQICARVPPGEAFNDSELYFSNTLAPDVTGDTRLSRESEQGLRAFMRELTTDAEFRAHMLAGATTPEERRMISEMLALYEGVEDCWTYGGIVQSGRLELTSSNTLVDGRPAPYLDRPVQPMPLGQRLVLRPN